MEALKVSILDVTTLADVLKRRREAMSLTQAALAKRAGVSQSTIGNLEAGTRGITDRVPGTLHKIADALHTSTDELLIEAGLIRRGAKRARRAYDANVVVSPKIPLRAVPKIDWAQATQLDELDEDSLLATSPVEWVDPDYGPATVALTIHGDSMEPEFREGDTIIVDPDVTPRPGDFVVASNHVHEATFKKYRPRGGGVYELMPLNDDYPTLRSDQDRLSLVGVMVEHRKRRRA